MCKQLAIKHVTLCKQNKCCLLVYFAATMARLERCVFPLFVAITRNKQQQNNHIRKRIHIAKHLNRNVYRSITYRFD